MSELPQGWAWSNLAELSNMVGGKTPSKADPRFWANGTIPWVSPKDMKVFDLRKSEDQISDLAVSEGGMSLLAAESILMVTRSGILAHTFPVAIAHEPVTINQDIKAVPPGPGFNTRYLAYSLKAQEQTILTECAKSGTTVASVETERLNKLPIPLAPLPEQKRIADKLDSTLARVEACRDRLDRLPTLLKRFRQSILAAATSGRLTEDWRATRSPDEAQRNLGALVPKSGAYGHSLPAGWDALTVGDLALDLRYGTSQKCDYREGGLPVLRIPNIGESGKVDLTDIKRADFAPKEAAKLELQAGDLLLIRSNGSVDLVGKCCILESDAVGYLFAGYLMRLRTDPEKILPWFLYFGFTAPEQRQRIELISKSTSGVNNINSDEVKSLPLLVPPIDEQHEIVRRVETLFAFADRLEARLATARKQAEQLTPALLAKAFRGLLVPQDPDDEPASELLKRLAANRTDASRPRRGRKAAA